MGPRSVLECFHIFHFISLLVRLFLKKIPFLQPVISPMQPGVSLSLTAHYVLALFLMLNVLCVSSEIKLFLSFTSPPSLPPHLFSFSLFFSFRAFLFLLFFFVFLFLFNGRVSRPRLLHFSPRRPLSFALLFFLTRRDARGNFKTAHV